MSFYTKKDAKHLCNTIRTNSAYTLIEVLVVVGILVMVASIAVPQLLNAFEQARLQKLEIDAKQILAALDRSVLNDRMKGNIAGNIELSLTPTVLIDAYGLNLSETNNAEYKYVYSATTGKSYIAVTYGGRTYKTNEAEIGWKGQ